MIIASLSSLPSLKRRRFHRSSTSLLSPVGDELRDELADDGRHHEAVTHEAARLVEVLDLVDAPHNGVRVRA